MTARHYVIGLVLWLGLLGLGARWAAGPVISMDHMGMSTAEAIKEKYPIRLAAFPEPVPQDQLAKEDEEESTGDKKAQDWALREMRNRALVVFLLWVASGFLIHWVVKRILAGEVDYT